MALISNRILKDIGNSAIGSIRSHFSKNIKLDPSFLLIQNLLDFMQMKMDQDNLQNSPFLTIKKIKLDQNAKKIEKFKVILDFFDRFPVVVPVNLNLTQLYSWWLVVVPKNDAKFQNKLATSLLSACNSSNMNIAICLSTFFQVLSFNYSKSELAQP